MTEDDLTNMSDEDLERIAQGEGADYGQVAPDLSAMSDEDLERIARGESPTAQVQQPAETQNPEYGFSDRQADQIQAQSGREAYAGQSLVEGLTPFQRGIREGVNREEDQNRGAFLDGTALKDALKRHGDAPDDSMLGYKAREFGAVETGVREFGHNLSAQAANLPFFIGDAVKGVRGLARRGYNSKATDVLIDYARDAGFADEDIEKAKEYSQGDPSRMNDFFKELSEFELRQTARGKEDAAVRLAENADGEGVVSKIAGGALGMIPMIEEFALVGAAGKALAGAKAARATQIAGRTWQGRLANGLKHAAWMTSAMGTEFTRRRYGELTSPEYAEDENGELKKIEGDKKGLGTLGKAAAGGYGEAAIFSLPIGEAAFGWAPKVISKALRKNVAQTVAKMYENYVRYGQLTGLRGQPVMLGLMDANTFKDEVLGLGKKDADYAGFDEEWRKFWDETMSAENQMDVFVSTLGVIAMQGGMALAKARASIAKHNRLTDKTLKDYLGVPDELLKKMAPEQKDMWRKLIMQRSRGEGFALNEKNLQNFCERIGTRLGDEAKSLFEEVAKYALEKDNSRDWMNGVSRDVQTKFSVPVRRNAETGNNEVDWYDDAEDANGRQINVKRFTDEGSGITVTKMIPTDMEGSDSRYVYVVSDRDGNAATRYGIADAVEAAKQMESASVVNRRQRQNKLNYLTDQYKKLLPGQNPIVFDTAEQYEKASGRMIPDSVNAETLDNGRQVYILDRFKTPQQMMKSILHEAGRHHGLDMVFPNVEDRMKFLVRLAKSGDPVIQDQVQRIMDANGIESEKEFFKQENGQYRWANKIEEVYAHLFDHEGMPSDPTSWEQHINVTRSLLRKVFHGLSVNRTEAEEVYRGAMEKLAQETGGAIDYRPDEPMPEPKTPRQEHEERMARKEAGRAKYEWERDELEAAASEEAAKIDRALADYAAQEVEHDEAQDRLNEAFAPIFKEATRIKARHPELWHEMLRAAGGDEAEAVRLVREDQLAENRRRGEEKRVAAEAKAKTDAQAAEMRRIQESERRKIDEREAKAASEAAEQERYDAEMTAREEEKGRRAEAERIGKISSMRDKARENERIDHEKRLKDAESEEKARIAQERQKQAQEREEEKRASYAASDEKARHGRENALRDAFQRDDSIRGAEELQRRKSEMADYEALEEARKSQEMADERRIRAELDAGTYDPNAEPPVIVAEDARKKDSLHQPGDTVRTSWRGKNKQNQVVVRAERDKTGKLLGWNVMSAEPGKREQLITSVPYATHSASAKKQTAGEALKAATNALKKYFGDPTYPVSKLADRIDEGHSKAEKEAETEKPVEVEKPAKQSESTADAPVETNGEVRPKKEIFDGRNRDLADSIENMFGDFDESGALKDAPKAGEGTTVKEAEDFLSSLPSDFRFFDSGEELMSAERAEGNRRLVNMIAAMYDQRHIRGFYDFAKVVKEKNPSLFDAQSNKLADVWNYAAGLSGGEIPHVGAYAARDAIESARVGQNVRDVGNRNILDAIEREVDVTMMPAADLNSSDDRVPNTKVRADSRSGIIKELPGRPRSLLAKPIVAIEFDDGEVHVVTGRHRKDLYERFGMDIPVRILRERDGWVRKNADGTYDISKLRAIDALDNIQDGKGDVEDYVGFFTEYAIDRESAEREGFLGSKEARAAYAISKDATPDLRQAINYEGGKRDGMIKPEQAGAIAAEAPKDGAEYNKDVQREVLRDVLKDPSMDERDIRMDVQETVADIKREIEAGRFTQDSWDAIFGGGDQAKELRDKRRAFKMKKIAEFERLAKDIRSAKNSVNGLTIKREDMRKLGINEREIAKGGADRRRELEKAASAAAMRAVEWGLVDLKPEDRAEMDAALGIKPDPLKDPAFVKWANDTKNPISEASRYLFDNNRQKEADLVLKSFTADELKAEDAAIEQRKKIAEGLERPLEGGVGNLQESPLFSQVEGGQMDLFFDKREERSASMDFGQAMEAVVRGQKMKTFGDFAKYLRDKNPAAFKALAPRLGEIWNIHANAMGVASVTPEEYNSVIHKLGEANGRNTTNTKSGDGTLGRGQQGRGVPGGGSDRGVVRGEGGDVGVGTGTGGTGRKAPKGTEQGNRDNGAEAPVSDGGRAAGQPAEVATGGSGRSGVQLNTYHPAKARFDGAKVSATPMVESRGLRGIEPPDLTYKLHVPQKFIEGGDLQEHQLEHVAYTGQTHDRFTEDGRRLATIAVHGTGAGKTRIAAGVILDNWEQGRKRAVWVSVNHDLKEDAMSDLAPFGLKDKVYDLKDGSKMRPEGIAFGSYGDLKRDGAIDNIVKSLGKDFDGVIVFDEAHAAKTMYNQSGNGHEEGLVNKAVVELQDKLPKARVLYMSATPATELKDLNYATRLGLWGPGTKFKDFADFHEKVKGKKLRGMEAISQALKMRGQLFGCGLSDDGVDFREVKTITTDEQKAAYRQMNDATRDVFEGVYDALAAMGDLSNTTPPSSLHGMQQRMHNSMLAAVKLPQIIEKAKEHLANGDSPVFSLFYTNAAGSEREVTKAAGRGEALEMDEANFGPKQILLDFLTNEKPLERLDGERDTQFPTKVRRTIVNPMSGETETVVEGNAAARAIRARLIAEVEKLPDTFGNPINMIMDAFGKENVANLTGLNEKGFAADYEAFKNGEKKVLVFSKKANTGFTFSSDKKYKNQARRAFFKIQNEWRADDFEQAKGRVHRNNQASAPIFYTTTTDLPGEARFFSTIARRKGQLSAITQGDRTVGGEMIGERHNLEDDYSAKAIQGTVQAIINSGRADAFARLMNFTRRTEDGTSNRLMDKNGNAAKIRPSQFWNRVPLLPVEWQERVFDAFQRIKERLIQDDINDGKYDRGLQDSGAARADDLHSFGIADRMSIEHVNEFFKTNKVTFDDFVAAHGQDAAKPRFVRNRRTGEIFAIQDDGQVSSRNKNPAVVRWSVDGKRERMPFSRVDATKDRATYEDVELEDAKSLWDAEYGIIPDERAEDGFYARGDLLEHWNDIVGSSMPQSFSVKTGKREFVGTRIPFARIPEIMRTYGKGDEVHGMIVDSVVRQILNNKQMELADGGLKVKGVPRDGGRSVMISGFGDKEAAKKFALELEMDAKRDNLPSPEATPDKKRVFIKGDADTLRNVIEKRPVKLFDEDERQIGDTSRFFNIDEEAGRRVRLKRQEDAIRMEGAGADRREIWEKTGWWRAKDGKWRVEIPGISADDTKSMLDFALGSGKFYDKSKDAKMNTYAFTFDDLERAMKADGRRLPDSVKTLLAAYPELGKTRIVVDRMAEQPKDGTLGFASDKEIHLYERGTTAETLNHELQHKVQNAAGMARGTNTNGKSFDRYAHELGEWEARQAATRAAMTPEERAKTPPWETADRHGVSEDATMIDDANKKRIRADGEEKPERQPLPEANAKQSWASRYHTNFTDRYHPILEMERADGRKKDELYNPDSPYNAMRLLHGHNEASRMRYEHQWRRPFEKMLRDSGVTVDDVGLYMTARNTKDRNARILRDTGRLEGAGLSDADADKFMSDLRENLSKRFPGQTDAKMKAIEDMADFLWKMQAEGMDRRVESGRVSAKAVAQWRKDEPFHVPMRDDLSDDGELNYSTRQWRRNEFKKAEGRYTMPDNPVEFMFKEYQEAVYGSNVNDARKTMAKYIMAHPGLGVVKRGVRKGKAWSFTHGQIEDFPDPNYHEQSVKGGSGKPNLIAFKDKGDLMMIELDGKLGERVASAVIGRDVANAPKPLQNAMRLYASTATEWSPTFVGRNFTADMLESALNTIADKGIVKGGYSAIKHVADALAMTRTIYAYNRRGAFEGKYADVMREYVESGASIGGSGNEGYTELEKRFEKIREKPTAKDVLKIVGEALSVYNKQAELATRLAVFKDYRDGGASVGEAAMRSREYTTDFNKYGNQRWMNSAWMFSGSVIGSAMRQVESLARGKHGKQLLTALFAYGVAEALSEHFYNAEDDERRRKAGEATGETMTEYARANSLYFRHGDKYARCPFHAGPFSVIKYLGNLTARAALGDIDWRKWAVEGAKETAATGVHFTGMGDAGANIMQTFVPTLLVPFFQHAENKNFAGQPIKKQMYSQTLPYSENGRALTGEGFKSAARWMNEKTGGNPKRRGWLDVAPETLSHFWNALGKNTARDIEGVYDFVSDMIGGDVKIEHVPFGRDYERTVPDNTQNFFSASESYKKDLADNTIRSESRKAKTINGLLAQINNLRHWEAGEKKVGQKWVLVRNPPAEAVAKYKAMRLKAQQAVIDIMGRK